MKVDTNKPVQVVESCLGKDYLELNLTLENGKEVEIAMLATSMAACGLMMHEVATRVISKQITEGYSPKWASEPTNLNRIALNRREIKKGHK